MAEAAPLRRRRNGSILHAMGAILLVGIGLGALQNSTFAWLRTVYAVTVMLLLFAILAAFLRPQRERAFWLGFAVFGWGYALVGISPWHTWGNATVARFPTYQKPAINPILWTKDLVEAYIASRPDLVIRPLRAEATVAEYEDYRAKLSRFQERSGAVVGIAHLLLVWVLGLVGGVIAIVMSWSTARAEARAVSPT